MGGSSLSAIIPIAADLGVTGDITFASEYNFRGYEVANNSLQASLEASLGDFYVGFFANAPRGFDGPLDLTDEYHYFGGFAVEVPGLQGLLLDVGITVYDWPEAGDLPGVRLDRTHEVYVGTKFNDIVNLDGVSAAVYLFHDIDRRANVAEAKVGYRIPLLSASEELALDLTALYGYQFGGSIRDRGLRINENYHYYGASAEVPFEVSEYSTLTAGVHYRTAEKARLAALGTRGQNLFWTISYTAGF